MCASDFYPPQPTLHPSHFHFVCVSHIWCSRVIIWYVRVIFGVCVCVSDIFVCVSDIWCVRVIFTPLVPLHFVCASGIRCARVIFIYNEWYFCVCECDIWLVCVWLSVGAPDDHISLTHNSLTHPTHTLVSLAHPSRTAPTLPHTPDTRMSLIHLCCARIFGVRYGCGCA